MHNGPIDSAPPSKIDHMKTFFSGHCRWNVLYSSELAHNAIWKIPLDDIKAYQWNMRTPDLMPSLTVCRESSYYILIIWLPDNLHIKQ